jgi:hypothetical protein
MERGSAAVCGEPFASAAWHVPFPGRDGHGMRLGLDAIDMLAPWRGGGRGLVVDAAVGNDFAVAHHSDLEAERGRRDFHEGRALPARRNHVHPSSPGGGRVPMSARPFSSSPGALASAGGNRTPSRKGGNLASLHASLNSMPSLSGVDDATTSAAIAAAQAVSSPQKLTRMGSHPLHHSLGHLR